MRLRGIDATRCSRGWKVDVHYTETTANQCSDEERHVPVLGGWLLTTIILGLIVARIEAREIRAKPGERAAKGWV